jgi:hypothetical protein
MPVDVRLYLKQLELDELAALAKYIEAKIPPKGTSRSKLADILYSHHISKNDVIAFLSKPIGRTGIYAKYDGKFKGFKDMHEDDVEADITWTKLRHKKPPIQGFIVTSGVFEPLAFEEKAMHDDVELLRLRF